MIVQSDFSIFLETNDPNYEEKRDFLATIGHLEKSPEYMHTYKITNLSLWTAAALEITLEFIIEGLKKYSRFDVPSNVIAFIKDYYSRYGRIELLDYDESFYLIKMGSGDKEIIKRNKKVVHFIKAEVPEGFLISIIHRGAVKLALIYMDPPYPVKDLASFSKGEKIDPVGFIGNWNVRPYQKEAATIFSRTGYGVIVLPCGAGKTIVGLEVLKSEQVYTLIVTPHHASLTQWKNEILTKTDIPKEMVGEYSGARKEIKPITLATYQILSYQTQKDVFKHLEVFSKQNWGLIIYDEVHMLPAPIFKVTTEIQSIKRLGLTATLVREDGKEKEVFALIGPKRYDIPWKELEHKNYIAKGICVDCRISFTEAQQLNYFEATKRDRPRIAAENPLKEEVVYELTQKHKGEKIIIIGQYLSQLKRISERLKVPLVTGKLSNKKREIIYGEFKNGDVSILVLSKVANLALDLPDASIAIQVSGAYGSRQEEAQRLGRILRPKDHPAYFYSIVTKNTVDEEFSMKRQMFLVEQGYQYQIEDWD